jgi:hypothetical protein
MLSADSSTFVETAITTLIQFTRRGGFFRELGDDTSGYVGFNISTHLPQNRVGLSPIVGVVYSPIEDLIIKLGRAPFADGPTISTAVGYLTPEGRPSLIYHEPVLEVRFMRGTAGTTRILTKGQRVFLGVPRSVATANRTTERTSWTCGY